MLVPSPVAEDRPTRMPAASDKPNASRPSVSLIIISKCRPARLRTSVAAHLAHAAVAGIPIELVVIEEAPAAVPIPGVEYVHLPLRHLGFGYSRNCGLRRASGDIIVFADDDVTPSAAWLPRLLAVFADPHVLAAGGGVIPQPDGIGALGAALGALGFPAGGPARIAASGLAPVPSAVISSGNCAFRRSVLDQVHGFDEALVAGTEDSVFFRRLAALGETRFVGGAFAYHEQREDLSAVAGWALRRGRGYFCRDRLEHGVFFSALGDPLRSLLLKALAGLVLAGLAAWAAGLLAGAGAALLLSLLWYASTAWRAATPLRRVRTVPDVELRLACRPLARPKILALAPVAKALIDVGEDLGRLQMAGIYLRNRFFTPPVILTFHHLTAAAEPPPAAQRPYVFRADDLPRLAAGFRAKGYRLCNVAEIARRLRTCPASLFFQKLAAVSFDDAWRDIGPGLTAFLETGGQATVFVVADHAGGTAEWEDDEWSRAQPLLSWAELRPLAAAGAEIGAHTCTHPALHKLDDAEQAREIGECRQTIEHELGCRPAGLAYPFGGFRLPETPQIARIVGFDYAVSSLSGHVRCFTNPWLLPRLRVEYGDDLHSLCRRARGLLLRETLRDIRDARRRRSAKAVE